MRILKEWYKTLDAEYGEHGQPEDPCQTCYEAIQLGIIGDRVYEPDEVIEDEAPTPTEFFAQNRED